MFNFGNKNNNNNFFNFKNNNDNYNRNSNQNDVSIKFSNVSTLQPYKQQFEDCLIENNSMLQKVLDSFLNDDKVFIMYELQKEYSYNQKLSLLQISNGKKFYSIDMMNESLDDDAIRNFLMYNKIQKVVYDADKFLSCIYQRYKKLPQNIFDITTASMLCGIDKKYQYRQMLLKVLGRNYKIKDPIKINYKQRPLSPRAVDRSILNVIHLEDLYNFIFKEISQFNRIQIHNEIVSEMINEDRYFRDVEESWTKIKFYTTKIDTVRRIKKIAEWREFTAKKMNLHPHVLMTDEVLIDVAERNPTCYEELAGIKNINKALLRPTHSKRIISAITAAQKLILEKTDLEAHVDELPSKYLPLADMFKILLRMKSQEHKISARLIASNADLAIIADSKEPKVRCLEGWRYQVFGKDVLKMKEGKVMLVCENNNLTLFDYNN